jgi:hypothetical protein
MLDFEDIRDLREEWEFTLDRDAYRSKIAAYVEGMAVGDVGRAELLMALSESLLMEDAPSNEDLERVIGYAHEAMADGGELTTDPRVEIVEALDRLGRADEMLALVRSCLRDRTPAHVHVDLHADLGEVLEMRGHLELAQRAFTIGVKDFEPDLDEPDFDEDMCLGGRYRVRRALGAGFDPLDRAFENFKPDAAAAIRERSGS